MELPILSEGLELFVDGMPSDFKPRLNGMVAEQRIYTTAELFRVMLLENAEFKADLEESLGAEGAQFLTPEAIEAAFEEAGDLLIIWGKHYMPIYEPEKDWEKVFSMVLHPQARELMIKMLMSYTPNWEKIINDLRGTEFEMGNNHWRIEGYQQREDVAVEGRERAGILLRSIAIAQEQIPKCPTIPVGDAAIAATHQVEAALGYRIA